MTEINFYVSSSASSSAIYKLLPSLLTKIIAQDHTVLIACVDQTQSDLVNKYLWEATDFLPHGKAEDKNPEKQPILITTQDDNVNHSDILVCLSGKSVSDYSSYLKVIDLFEGSEEQKQAGRTRWTDYKNKGYSLSYSTSENGKWTKKM